MESGSKNPLLIDHIVEKVFSNDCFSDSDLLSLRSVCREWDQAATKKFRRTLLRLREEQDHARMVTAISLLDNPQGNLPIIKQLAFSEDFFTDVPGFQANLGKFLSLLSNEIEELSLGMDCNCKMVFNEDFYSDVLSFPRLKVMELDLWNEQKAATHSNYFLSLAGKIFKSSSVQILNIYWDTCTYRNDFAENLLDILPKSVRKLDISGYVTRQLVQAFPSLFLPNLISLNWLTSYSYTSISRYDIYNLFNNNKNNTLVQLRLDLAEERIWQGFELPVFVNLNILELWINYQLQPATNSELAFPSIFPKVSKFLIHGHTNENFMLALFPTGFAAPKVESCSFKLSVVSQSQSQFLNLAQGLLGLKKLSILPFGYQDNYVGLSSISVIFEWCLLLEELEVDFKLDEDLPQTDVDSILTGIPTLVCENFRSAPNPDWAVMEIAEVKERPGLSDLKNLKNLYLTSSHHSAILTNVTGYFGFLQLPKLEKLFTNEFQMSEEFILSLKLRFGENAILTIR